MRVRWLSPGKMGGGGGVTKAPALTRTTTAVSLVACFAGLAQLLKDISSLPL